MGLFGCKHLRQSFPLTPRGNRKPIAACLTGTYVACLDCGKELPYDWNSMSVVTPKKEKEIRMKIITLGLSILLLSLSLLAQEKPKAPTIPEKFEPTEIQAKDLEIARLNVKLAWQNYNENLSLLNSVCEKVISQNKWEGVGCVLQSMDSPIAFKKTAPAKATEKP